MNDANDHLSAKSAKSAKSANDYLSMLFERSNAAQSLWTFESVVVLGLVGFLATAGRNVGNFWIEGLITVVFAGFALFNLLELRKVSHQREILAERHPIFHVFLGQLGH